MVMRGCSVEDSPFYHQHEGFLLELHIGPRRMLQEPRYLANRFSARVGEHSEYAGILTTEVGCVDVEAIDMPRSPQLDDTPVEVRKSVSASVVERGRGG